MFSQWDCGCVGINIPDGESIILLACDADRDAPAESVTWFRRDMRDKTLRAVSSEREQRIHQRIALRFSLADRFDGVIHALGIPREPMTITRQDLEPK